MPQWVRLSALLGRICGRLPTWTAMAKRAGNTTAQELGALGHGLERSGMRPTLAEQVPRCNKGRTQELTARCSTPARSANQQQDKAAFARWQGLHGRTATGPMFLMVPAAAAMPRTTTVRALS